MLIQRLAPRSQPVQQELDLRRERRGGARKGAGRKARPERVGLAKHVRRPRHTASVPVHVTARAVKSVPHLRTQRVFAVVRGVLARSSEKGLRVLHFSVQDTHIHLIVEAEGGAALGRGMQRLLSRVAMAINTVARRHGKVWGDRYHRQDLGSPSQVRNAYVYVLFNIRKHARTDEELAVWQHWLDPCSSARWFTGWAPRAGPDASQLAAAGPPIVAAPRTWLARTGWDRRGLLRMTEQPRPAPT